MRYDRAKYKLTAMENALRVLPDSYLVWDTDGKKLIAHDGITVGGLVIGPGSGGGGIPEAPLDARVYGRQGSTASWIALSTVGPVGPGTAAPNGAVVGHYKGQVYGQKDSGGTYLLRTWIFDGVAGQNTGWL